MPETISVAELNTRVKDVFSKTPGINDIWVSGEISNFKSYPSGYYFVLKDATSEIHAVMFKSAVGRIDFVPQENMKVTAFGSIGMYVPRGTYQFIVETMKKSGIGDRYIAFEKLKKKLDEEGLFSQEHKRPLPAYPRRIGVVTSQSGAVIHDIITTSESRFTADIILAPAMVQGDGAAETIVAGIKLLNKAEVDVIIVGRGGGSIEDLWPFNEEIVARAIYESPVPIVSAVGHETDFTIADFVADVRAPTPTGAAAIILRDKNEIRSQIVGYMGRLNMAMNGVLEDMKHSFQVVDSKLDPKKALDMLQMHSMELDHLSMRADAALSDKVRDMRVSFSTLDARLQPGRALEVTSGYGHHVESMLERIRSDAFMSLEKGIARYEIISERPERGISEVMNRSESVLGSDSRQLEGLNPLNVLTRGYSIIQLEDGTVITSADKVSVGDTVSIRFRDGTAKAGITKKEMN